MNEHKGRKCSKCKNTQPLDNFDNGKALCQKCSEYKQRYREKATEKNCDKNSGNAMNNAKDRNLRNRKKRLNVPCVRLIFQEAKCQDTKEPNDIKTISTNLTQNK